MTCAKCGKAIPDGASYCCWCGRLLGAVPKRNKKATNGSGYAFRRKGTWSIRVTTGFSADDSGRYKQHYRTKGGFKSKADALAYASLLKKMPCETASASMSIVYHHWRETYTGRVVASTMKGYDSAMKHYAQISYRPIAEIRPVDLQKCIDGCPAGKRTKQLMKVVAGLIWKYAIDSDIVSRNAAQNLYTGNDETTTYPAFTIAELHRIRQSSHPYAPYVVCLCYLGFRPSEMLNLKKSDINIDEMYIIGGSKTDAGRDRTVTIPPPIQGIIRERYAADSGLLFPRLHDGKKLTHEYFRKNCFDPLMDELGITDRVPYSCRHTYSNLIKHAPGDSGDKARLMGHTDYTFTQERYQSSDLDDLRRITDSLE